MIIKTQKEKYVVLKEFSLIVPHQMSKEISKRFAPAKEILENNQNALKKHVSVEEIKEKLANAASLCLGTTQNCNLRCKYCVYGGKYKYRRTHKDAFMTMDIYKKAIDFYFDLVNSPHRSNRKPIVLSYYGGEPLLAFQHLLASFDYAIQKFGESPIKIPIRGLITTNGVLLNRERVEKLLDRNFRIDISLDGPQDQHDKFRVTVDNRGTFDDIMSHIIDIKTNFPVQFQENFRFFLTIHPLHDIKRIETFLLSNPEIFNERNVLISWVDFRRIKIEYKKKWGPSALKQQDIIDRELDQEQWFYKNITGSWLEKIYINPTSDIEAATHFTGTCLPGLDKLFIDTDGGVHICEKINSHFPIGHVNSGLDMNKISTLIADWNNDILKRKCWECDLWWLCFFCFANASDNKSIHLDEQECRKFIVNNGQSLVKFLNLMEKEDEIKSVNRYIDMDHYLDSLQ
ncbi:MAG: radical SAM protein [Candidatus Omnitrophota bacterium]